MISRTSPTGPGAAGAATIVLSGFVGIGAQRKMFEPTGAALATRSQEERHCSWAPADLNPVEEITMRLEDRGRSHIVEGRSSPRPAPRRSSPISWIFILDAAVTGQRDDPPLALLVAAHPEPLGRPAHGGAATVAQHQWRWPSPSSHTHLERDDAGGHALAK